MPQDNMSEDTRFMRVVSKETGQWWDYRLDQNSFYLWPHTPSDHISDAALDALLHRYRHNPSSEAYAAFKELKERRGGARG